ncbi:MAG: sodium:proton antiporter, partial [Desulfobulbaceae bacterium]|nr:sodium:proton antiporter [Desulfobulbaceae bacterium]
MNESIAITLAAIIVLGSLCQWAAWKVKLPAIIFLLLSGILAGPVFGLLQPDLLLGDLLFPFVSLSVAVILFEGSLTLRFREIKGMGRIVWNMVTYGMLITLIITTLVTHWAIGLSWNLSLLFGTISVVTGPTVIVPILRTVRPNAKIANILRWEGIVIDPIGASLAVLVYEFIIAGGDTEAWSHTLHAFGLIVAAGILLGLIGGYLFGLLLKHHLLPEYLHNITTLSLVFGAFTLSNILAHESGLVCVTVMGILLTNMKGVDIEEILDFKESLSILLISVLFILLAARMDFADFRELGINAVLVLLAIQFLARPLNIMASTFGSSLTW